MASDQKEYIVIFGAGDLGREVLSLLRAININVCAFTDNDRQKRALVIDGLECVAPEDLSKESIVIVSVLNNTACKNVIHQLENMGITSILNVQDIVDGIILAGGTEYDMLLKKADRLDLLLNYYLDVIKLGNTPDYPRKNIDFTNTRIAVYTGNFGNYDDIFEPEWTGSNVDFYYISDNKTDLNKLNKMKWINAKDVIPDAIKGNKERNRYIKMNPVRLFPDYRYTLYVDGTDQIVGDIRKLLYESVTGINCFNHPYRDCIYKEALACIAYKKADYMQIHRQLEEYRQAGMPVHYGLAELGVIGLDTHNKNGIKIIEEWQKEFQKYPYRDQISFAYILWRNGISVNELGIMGPDRRENDFLKVHQHCYEKKSLA